MENEILFPIIFKNVVQTNGNTIVPDFITTSATSLVLNDTHAGKVILLTTTESAVDIVLQDFQPDTMVTVFKLATDASVLTYTSTSTIKSDLDMRKHARRNTAVTIYFTTGTYYLVGALAF